MFMSGAKTGITTAIMGLRLMVGLGHHHQVLLVFRGAVAGATTRTAAVPPLAAGLYLITGTTTQASVWRVVFDFF